MKESNFEIVNRSKTIDKKKAEVESFNEELKKYLKDTDDSYLVGGSEYFGDTFCIKPLEIKNTKNGFIVNVYTMNMSDFYTYGQKNKWTKDKYLITTKKENGKTIVWGWSDENSDYMEGGFAKPFAELKRCLKKSIKNYEEGIDFSMDKGKSNLVSLELPKEIEYKGKKVKITADGIRAFIVGNERFGYGEGRINYLGDPTNGLENAEKEAVEEIKRMIDYAFEKKDLLKSVIEKAKKNKKCYAICHTTMSEKHMDIESKYDVVKEWTILNKKDPYHAITEYKNTKPERKVVFYPDYIVDKNGKLIDDRDDYKKERFDNYVNFSILDDIFSGGILMF